MYSENEKIYNIIMSFFIGFFVVFFINGIFDKPRIPIIYKK